MVAGPNGSGKTSLTEQGLRHEWFEECLYINPDQIARDEFGDWNSPEAVLKAVREAEKRRHEALGRRSSLAFETVLSTTEKIDFIRQAKEAGYFIRLFFVSTESPAINAARVTQRFIEGGHEVPIAKIVSRFGRSVANGILAAKLADRAYFYDNSVDGQAARLLFRTESGKIRKRYSALPPWAKLVAGELR